MLHLIEALPTATKFINEMTCDALLQSCEVLFRSCEVLFQSCDALFQSCEVLFHGDKTGFLAKSTSQPPVLKQKSTSQVVRIASQVAGSTSQVAAIKSQPKISTARVSQDAQRYPSPTALPR